MCIAREPDYREKGGNSMKLRFSLTILLHAAVISILSNSYIWVREIPQSLYLLIPMFILANLLPEVWLTKTRNKRFRFCLHGTVLLYAFYISLVISTVIHIILAVIILPEDSATLLWSLAVCFGVNFVVFWNGIISVYFTSAQVGTKLRVVGILCGMIPVANLLVLYRIIKATTKECFFRIRKRTTEPGETRKTDLRHQIPDFDGARRVFQRYEVF